MCQLPFAKKWCGDFFAFSENKIEDKDSADECKQPKNESEDIDDGFSKSDDDECSFHSASETLADFKSSASSTSGLASTTSSTSSGVGHISEIVQKFHISREANDAIFKPGIILQCFICLIGILCRRAFFG